MLISLKFAVFFITLTTVQYNPLMLKHDCSSAPPGEIYCHDKYIIYDLPTADDWEFPEKSIFFVETSCKGGLDSRQACSVESAARAHPLWQVNVLFAGPVHIKCHLNPAFLALKRYGNVNLFRIHPMALAKNTPLEDFLNDLNPLEYSFWPISHASDVLRYLVLYKWSGIYLDHDMMVLKPFDGLAKNWAAKEVVAEQEHGVASGALRMSSDQLGRNAAAIAVEEIKTDYRGWKWAYNGPGVIQRVLRRICSTNNPGRMSPEKCQGFAVYATHLFYPVEFKDAIRLFNKGQLDLGSAYTCHAWTSSVSQVMDMQKGSPYATLAASHCPWVVARFGSSFGTMDAVL